jgi:ectoine hydroxylase-related dioxygenase (phytanoyl-CoA dioxygenase family)
MTHSLVKKADTKLPVENVLDIINRDGTVILSGLLNPKDIKRLSNDVNPLFNRSEFCDGHFYGVKTKRVHALIAKSEVYRKLAVHPFLLELMNRILGPFCERIQINVTQGIQIWPGAPAQILHRDDTKFPVRGFNCEFMVNVIIAVDKFTKENGCTRFALGSHKWEDRKRRPTEDELSYAEMEPGEAEIIIGSVMHGGGENRSSAPRAGIVLGYCLGWVRQTENQYLVAPPKVAKNYSEELQDLLGYSIHRPNLGMYEGNEPKILFQEDPDQNFVTHDWLTPEQEQLVEKHYATRAL